MRKGLMGLAMSAIALALAAIASTVLAVAHAAGGPVPGAKCATVGKTAKAANGAQLVCKAKGGKKVWTRVGASGGGGGGGGAPSPGEGGSGAAPGAYAVTVKGTVSYEVVGTATTLYSGGGSGCTVTITARARDTLQYETDNPLHVAVTHGAGETTTSVPYAMSTNFGTEEAAPPVGAMPDGSACPPYGGLYPLTSGCGIVKGRLSLAVKIDGGKLTVSGKGHLFEPGACTGWHQDRADVPPSVASFPEREGSASVVGSGSANYPGANPGANGSASSAQTSRFVASVTPQ